MKFKRRFTIKDTENMSIKDQEFVEYLVKAIVDNPNDVSTERSVDEMGVLITLKVNQADMGNVIGRSGQTARAIRTLLRVVGARNNSRVNLKIYEPEGSEHSKREDKKEEKSDDPISAVDDLNL